MKAEKWKVIIDWALIEPKLDSDDLEELLEIANRNIE